MIIPDKLKLDIIQMNLLAIIAKREKESALKRLDELELFYNESKQFNNQDFKIIIVEEGNLLGDIQKMIKLEDSESKYDEKILDEKYKKIAREFKFHFDALTEIIGQTRKDKLKGIANTISYYNLGLTKSQYHQLLEDAGIDAKTLSEIKSVTGRDLSEEALEDRLLEDLD